MVLSQNDKKRLVTVEMCPMTWPIDSLELRGENILMNLFKIKFEFNYEKSTWLQENLYFFFVKL